MSFASSVSLSGLTVETAKEQSNVIAESIKKCVGSDSSFEIIITNISYAPLPSQRRKLDDTTSRDVIVAWLTSFWLETVGYSDPAVAFESISTRMQSEMKNGTMLTYLASVSDIFVNMTVGNIVVSSKLNVAKETNMVPTSVPTAEPKVEDSILAWLKINFYVVIVVFFGLAFIIMSVTMLTSRKGRSDVAPSVVSVAKVADDSYGSNLGERIRFKNELRAMITQMNKQQQQQPGVPTHDMFGMLMTMINSSNTLNKEDIEEVLAFAQSQLLSMNRADVQYNVHTAGNADDLKLEDYHTDVPNINLPSASALEASFGRDSPSDSGSGSAKGSSKNPSRKPPVDAYSSKYAVDEKNSRPATPTPNPNPSANKRVVRDRESEARLPSAKTTSSSIVDANGTFARRSGRVSPAPQDVLDAVVEAPRSSKFGKPRTLSPPNSASSSPQLKGEGDEMDRRRASRDALEEEVDESAAGDKRATFTRQSTVKLIDVNKQDNVKSGSDLESKASPPVSARSLAPPSTVPSPLAGDTQRDKDAEAAGPKLDQRPAFTRHPTVKLTDIYKQETGKDLKASPPVSARDGTSVDPQLSPRRTLGTNPSLEKDDNRYIAESNRFDRQDFIPQPSQVQAMSKGTEEHRRPRPTKKPVRVDSDLIPDATLVSKSLNDAAFLRERERERPVERRDSDEIEIGSGTRLPVMPLQAPRVVYVAPTEPVVDKTEVTKEPVAAAPEPGVGVVNVRKAESVSRHFIRRSFDGSPSHQASAGKGISSTDRVGARTTVDDTTAGATKSTRRAAPSIPVNPLVVEDVEGDLTDPSGGTKTSPLSGRVRRQQPSGTPDEVLRSRVAAVNFEANNLSGISPFAFHREKSFMDEPDPDLTAAVAGAYGGELSRDESEFVSPSVSRAPRPSAVRDDWAKGASHSSDLKSEAKSSSRGAVASVSNRSLAMSGLMNEDDDGEEELVARDKGKGWESAHAAQSTAAHAPAPAPSPVPSFASASSSSTTSSRPPAGIGAPRPTMAAPRRINTVNPTSNSRSYSSQTDEDDDMNDSV